MGCCNLSIKNCTSIEKKKITYDSQRIKLKIVRETFKLLFVQCKNTFVIKC